MPAIFTHPFPMTIQSMIVLVVLPLLGFLAWGLVRFRLAAKAKAYDQKKRDARIAQQVGTDRHPPSWHGSDDKEKEFFSGVIDLATHKGVPRPYAHTILGKEVNMRRLLWYLGALEDHGASLVEQQGAVVDQIVEWWAVEEQALEWAVQISMDQ